MNQPEFTDMLQRIRRLEMAAIEQTRVDGAMASPLLLGIVDRIKHRIEVEDRIGVVTKPRTPTAGNGKGLFYATR
jgi:malonyl CoA-acyl carrier protein transacylase